AGSEEGLFPHFSAINDKRGPGVDEERRLMYVAITRAKKKLVITNCESRMQYGETRSNEPSSFLSEIPEELLDQRDLCRRQYGYDDRSERYQRRDNGYSGWERPSFGGTSRSSGYGSDHHDSRYSSRERDDWRHGLSGRNAGTYRSKEEPLVKRRAEAAANDAFGYCLGDSVEHKKFGFRDG
ncbi:UvrD/REP helicase, partial [gut metagenome]